ncbi:MAG: type I-E CRISPR-associated protein Cas5/CasD [Kineosporiaceae bacterium]|nr:type I-E CRISPR-associated protein Cas5/CasD [Kineosporiaceae bacterium]
MTTLLLTLAAPLQSWGVASRFPVRATQDHPSKSGVIGLLAAAMGRRRTDPIEDLLGLRFGVRIDQAGALVRDFQTAHRADGASAPISERYYLGDAVFLAGLEGEASLVATLDGALRRPMFPLYLGRRACPPAGPIRAEVHDKPLRTVLETMPWRAARRIRRKDGRAEVPVDIVADADPVDDTRGDVVPALVRDVPQSFDPVRRDYGVRRVVRYRTLISNPDGARHAEPERVTDAIGGHDPFDALEA